MFKEQNEDGEVTSLVSEWAKESWKTDWWLLAEEQSVLFQREQHNFSGTGKIQAWNFTLQRVQAVIWGFLQNAGKGTGYINVSVYKDYFK